MWEKRIREMSEQVCRCGHSKDLHWKADFSRRSICYDFNHMDCQCTYYYPKAKGAIT